MPIQQWSSTINKYCAGELYYTNAQSLSLPHSLLIGKTPLSVKLITSPSHCVTVLFITSNVNNPMEHRCSSELFQIEIQTKLYFSD